MRQGHRHVTGLLLFLVCVGLAAPTFANQFEGQEVERRYLSDKFYFSVGWFGADISTDIAFGFGNNIGTSIRLEDDFDLEDNRNTLLFEANWRFSRKHALTFSSTTLNRSGNRVIDQDFDIELPGGDPDDGLRFNVGADVTSDFDNSIVNLIYRFSFYNNGKIDAGIAGGLSFFDFSLGLNGTATVIDEDGNEGSTGIRSTRSDFIAPIPTIGIHMAYALSPRFVFRFNTNVLDIDVGDFEGRINMSKTSIEWFFIKHVSLGAGLTTNNVEIKLLGDDPVRVDYRYGGFTVFFAAGF